MKKINDGLTGQQRYRQRHLEICRERTRINQLKLNNKKRFGGLKYKVLERDKYKCVLCKKNISGKNMHCLHHKDTNKQNNTMKNLVTLCKACHSSIHYNLRGFQYTTEKMKKIWKEHGIKYFNR
jgi:5-methylcytosine-specific restriction endonuclease McrA